MTILSSEDQLARYIRFKYCKCCHGRALHHLWGLECQRMDCACKSYIEATSLEELKQRGEINAKSLNE